MLLRPILTSILLALTLPLPLAAQSQGGDDVLLEMRTAYRRADKAALTQLLPATRGHPLEAWAAYWELKARLDDAQPEEIDAFLRRWAGTYQEDRLRNDWLLLLGKRRDWERFSAYYPAFRMRDDREVRCYALLIEHIARGPLETPNLAEQVRDNWFELRDADDGCTEAARRLVGDGAGARRIGNDDVWRKARLAMEANRYQAARNAVELISPESLPEMAQINASATKFLLARATAFASVRKELVTLALIKLAVSDPDQAAALLDTKWSPHLAADEQNWVWAVIAKQFATKLRPDALYYANQVTNDRDLNDDLLGWKVRAALRAEGQPDWKTVLGATAAMSDEGKRDPTWVYWRARALRAVAGRVRIETEASAAQKREAAVLLGSIASVRGFYEQLALEELGQQITVPIRPAPLTAGRTEDRARQPVFAARTLCGRNGAAQRRRA